MSNFPLHIFFWKKLVKILIIDLVQYLLLLVQWRTTYKRNVLRSSVMWQTAYKPNTAQGPMREEMCIMLIAHNLGSQSSSWFRALLVRLNEALTLDIFSSLLASNSSLLAKWKNRLISTYRFLLIALYTLRTSTSSDLSQYIRSAGKLRYPEKKAIPTKVLSSSCPIEKSWLLFGCAYLIDSNAI